MNRILMVVLLLLSPLCNGAGYYAMTPDERQLCISMFGVRGGSGEHICDCVRNYNRAVRETKWEEKKYYANESASSCTYFMVRHSENKGHPMDQHYPTAQMYRGMARLLTGDRAGATLDLTDAIRLNPRALTAYAQLSDTQAGMGNKPKALETVTEGLKHLPSSKQLQRRYLELGGKEPFPEPYQKGPAVSQQQTIQPTAKRPPESDAGVDQHAPSIEEKPVAPPPSLAPDAKVAPAASSTSPWCRFCPDAASGQPVQPAAGAGK